MAVIELLTRLESNQESMEQVGTALMKRDRPGAIAAMTRWVIGALSGVPALGALAQQGVSQVFASTATAAIEAELAALQAEGERRALIDDIAAAIEPLVQQAVIQLVRVQHDVDEARKDELTRALGGLREDLDSFRAAFARELERAAPAPAGNPAGSPAVAPGQVHISRQRVSGTGVGVLARGGGHTVVRIDWQEVLDRGVGIKLSGRARIFIGAQDVHGGVGVEQG
jgi:hypothetical protein